MEMALFELELTRSAKRVRNYAIRVLFPALLLVPIFGLAGQGMDAQTAETLGRTVHSAAFFFQQIVVLIVTPMLAAQTIARERTDRTLPLLLLSIPGGLVDVWLAKLAAVMLQSGLLILSTMPIVSFVVFLGGVSGGQVLFDFTCALIAMGCVACLGVAVSTWSHEPGQALRQTLLILFLWIAADFAWTLWPSSSPSPFRLHVFLASWNGLEPLRPLIESRLPGAVISVSVAALASVVSVLYLPRLIVERDARPIIRRRPSASKRCLTAEAAVGEIIRRCPGTVESRGWFSRAVRWVLIMLLSVLGWPVGVTLLALLCFHEVRGAIVYLHRSLLLEQLELACEPRALGTDLIHGIRDTCRGYLFALCMSCAILPGLPVAVASGEPLLGVGVLVAFGAMGAAQFHLLVSLSVQFGLARGGGAQPLVSFSFIYFMLQTPLAVFVILGMAHAAVAIVAMVMAVAVLVACARSAREDVIQILQIRSERFPGLIPPPKEWTYSGRIHPS